MQKKFLKSAKVKKVYLKLGDVGYDAVKFAPDGSCFPRCAGYTVHRPFPTSTPFRFEGGLLDGRRVTFSPHLNCLIGIQGSGKSSILESVRYALDIPFGEKAQDKEYKDKLLPHVLKSGGKVVVQATDRHGGRCGGKAHLGAFTGCLCRWRAAPRCLH